MRPNRMFRGAPALLLLLGSLAQTGGSQEMVRPDGPPAFSTRASNLIIPQSRAYITRPRVQPVRIVEVAANVAIVQQVATTSMTVTLENPSGAQQEAEMLVPVPDGAAVRSFTIAGGGQEMTARLLPKAEAKALYESIVRTLRDPGLLEFAGYNLVRSSVFPVPARGSQQVHLVYEHLLPADGDRVDYVLPRSESFESTAVRWKITTRVASEKPIATVYSPSHEVTTERDQQGRLLVKLADESKVEPGPFRLSYLVQGAGLTASLLAYPDPSVGGGYFLLLAGVPATKPSGDAAPVKREVTLVVDCSGSMAGEKLTQARAAALQVVEGLQDGEAFNVIDFSDTVDSFDTRPVVKDGHTIALARDYLKRLQSRGGTNINDALLQALGQQPTPDMLPLVLFLTDGLPTVGERREVAIRSAAVKANAHKRRIFTFGVGYDVNAPLLSALADATRAASTFVLPREDVEAKVGGVFRRLSGPVLADPRVEILDASGSPTTRAVRDMVPARPNDLFEGDQFVLLGRYQGNAPLTFRIAGEYLGAPRTFQFTFDLSAATTRNGFVPRLWARRKINQLIDEIAQAGAEERPRDPQTDPQLKELVDEIVRLSTEFGILTEYTAFLATEGVDLSNREQVRIQTGGLLKNRAQSARSGMGGVNQAMNVGKQKAQSSISKSNTYLNDKMERVEITNVQQINDRTFFKKSNRWVDARVLDKEKTIKPDQIVEFGTPPFERLVERLVSEGRQGMLALTGEILLVVDGKTVLVKSVVSSQ
jgi:Ca-activated chloride channel homolog